MSAVKLNHKAKRIGPVKIRLYGRMGPLGERQREANHLGRNLGAKTLCSILPANNDHPNAWHKIVEHQPGEILRGEGMVLRYPGQGVFLTSRDCPIVVAVDEATGFVGVAHAGRSSLMNINSECTCCDTGVLENMFAAMNLPSGQHLTVYVTGGISAKNFPNDPQLVKPFTKKFGQAVVPDLSRGTLDLFRVIKKICMTYGIKPERILSDGLCTFETEWTGSKRADRPDSNWTLVVKTS